MNGYVMKIRVKYKINNNLSFYKESSLRESIKSILYKHKSITKWEFFLKTEDNFAFENISIKGTNVNALSESI